MSATCSRCGDCCDAIHLSVDYTLADVRAWVRWRPWSSRTWRWDLWKHLVGAFIFRLRHGRPTNHHFVARHWHEIPGTEGFYSCDQFNAATRLCEARAQRPNVCRDYPWYGEEPVKAGTFPLTSRRCSFWADVPLDRRPHDLTFEV